AGRCEDSCRSSSTNPPTSSCHTILGPVSMHDVAAAGDGRYHSLAVTLTDALELQHRCSRHTLPSRIHRGRSHWGSLAYPTKTQRADADSRMFRALRQPRSTAEGC